MPLGAVLGRVHDGGQAPEEVAIPRLGLTQLAAGAAPALGVVAEHSSEQEEDRGPREHGPLAQLVPTEVVLGDEQRQRESRGQQPGVAAQHQGDERHRKDEEEAGRVTLDVDRQPEEEHAREQERRDGEC
jgi:hypothetical protein